MYINVVKSGQKEQAVVFCEERSFMASETDLSGKTGCLKGRFADAGLVDLAECGHGLEPLSAIIGRWLAMQAIGTSKRAERVSAEFVEARAAQDRPAVQEYRNLQREQLCEALV